MTIQTPKRLIDTGVEGVEGTGNTLFDGGELLNKDLNNIWNVFGDYRLYKGDSAHGDALMSLHATGYYQKHSRAYYAGGEIPSGNPVEFGSMHDVSVTRDGIGDLILTLPVGYGHQGECIEIVNTDGTIGFGTGKEFKIRVSGSGDAILGHGDTMTVQRPYFKIVLWVRDSAATGSTWAYKIESLFGDNSVPYSASIANLAPNNSRAIPLYSKSLFDCAKHIMHVVQRGNNVQCESSEVMLMVNNTNTNDNNVYVTEYARIRSEDPSDPAANLLYDANYYISAGNVMVNITNKGSVAIDVRIKAVEAIGGQF